MSFDVYARPSLNWQRGSDLADFDVKWSGAMETAAARAAQQAPVFVAPPELTKQSILDALRRAPISVPELALLLRVGEYRLRLVVGQMVRAGLLSTGMETVKTRRGFVHRRVYAVQASTDTPQETAC